MGTSLKEALLKAGLQSAKPESKKVKPSPAPSVKSFEEKKRLHTHQDHQIQCQVCNRIQPDVEYYKHNLPQVHVHWICCQCADNLFIMDECRETMQSEFARKGMFRRNFGRTKRFRKN